MLKTDEVNLPGIYLYKKSWNEFIVRAHVFTSRIWSTDSRGKGRFPFPDASHCGFLEPVKEQS